MMGRSMKMPREVHDVPAPNLDSATAFTCAPGKSINRVVHHYRIAGLHALCDDRAVAHRAAHLNRPNFDRVIGFHAIDVLALLAALPAQPRWGLRAGMLDGVERQDGRHELAGPQHAVAIL